MMKTLIMTKNHFRILQFTDIHMMYESTDQETYLLMNKAIKDNHPDIIVITGDLTMTHNNEGLLKELRDFLDHYQIPWTFVFGNHDHEAILSLSEQADILMKGKYCFFDKGNPNISGCGNHYLQVIKNKNIIALLGFLDSHNDRIDIINGEKIWSYDYIDQSQIDDAINTVENLKETYPDFSSLFFFHIPLTEYKTKIDTDRNDILGSCFEPISCSKYDSHFFEQLIKTNTLKGIFAGHDHVCDFSFEQDGCLLAFGRCTGHYNYTMPEFQKGARVIDINQDGSILSYIYLE